MKTEIQSATITSDSIEQKAEEPSQPTASPAKHTTSGTIKEETSAKAEKRKVRKLKSLFHLRKSWF